MKLKLTSFKSTDSLKNIVIGSVLYYELKYLSEKSKAFSEGREVNENVSYASRYIQIYSF